MEGIVFRHHAAPTRKAGGRGGKGAKGGRGGAATSKPPPRSHSLLTLLTSPSKSPATSTTSPRGKSPSSVCGEEEEDTISGSVFGGDASTWAPKNGKPPRIGLAKFFVSASEEDDKVEEAEEAEEAEAGTETGTEVKEEATTAATTLAKAAKAAKTDKADKPPHVAQAVRDALSAEAAAFVARELARARAGLPNAMDGESNDVLTQRRARVEAEYQEKVRCFTALVAAGETPPAGVTLEALEARYKATLRDLARHREAFEAEMAARRAKAAEHARGLPRCAGWRARAAATPAEHEADAAEHLRRTFYASKVTEWTNDAIRRASARKVARLVAEGEDDSGDDVGKSTRKAEKGIDTTAKTSKEYTNTKPKGGKGKKPVAGVKRARSPSS